MDRVTLTDDLSLSRMAYGMWRLADAAETGPAAVQAKVEACLAQGLTSMDQADIYGGYAAEALLGAAFRAAPGLRDRVELVTKCGIVLPVGRHAAARVKHYDTSRPHLQASVEASLRDMATDRIDLLLIHRPDPLMDHHQTGAALDALVASGKVRAVGVSNFLPHDVTLLQSAMETPLVSNQIEISLGRPAPFTDGQIAFQQERGMAPMAWSPLAGGALFAEGHTALNKRLREVEAAQGVDMSAVAVAWLLAHPARIVPVMGTNSPDRIARFSDAFRVEMDRQLWFDLYTAALGHEVP